MKRDMDLIRKIVFALEDHEHGFAPHALEIEGSDGETLGYHIHLCVQAGLVEGGDSTDSESLSPEANATCLTWKGHEFADAARDETIWSRAKAGIKDKVKSASFAVLTEYLKSLAKNQLGI